MVAVPRGRTGPLPGTPNGIPPRLAGGCRTRRWGKTLSRSGGGKTGKCPSDTGRAVTVRLRLSPRLTPLAPLPITPRHVGCGAIPRRPWAGIPGSARVGKGRAEAEHVRELTIPLAPCPGPAAVPQRRPALGRGPSPRGSRVCCGCDLTGALVPSWPLKSGFGIPAMLRRREGTGVREDCG